MSEIAKTVGQRIRNYRTQLGYSQEKLAELSGCHPTYIGQLERGEKNATLESVEKISSALGVTLSKLFEMIGDTDVFLSGQFVHSLNEINQKNENGKEDHSVSSLPFLFEWTICPHLFFALVGNIFHNITGLTI